MNDLTYLCDEAQQIFDYTREIRRDFHRNPEIGFNEVRTAGIVAGELNKIGIKTITEVGKTGVIGLLETSRPGPTMLVRFDMDALPIQEENGTDYVSCVKGVMHACGHDAHVAIGLSVAQLLARHQAEICGTVKFMFQPAEEGLGGAECMIADGVLLNPAPDFAIAVHVWNEKPLGWIGITPGPIMAASETFTVRITGKGGHGALPNKAIDPILATAHMITAVQSVASRNVSPLDTAVISVTSVHGGDAFNVIPSYVEIKGTIRTFDPDVRQLVLKRFREIIHQTGVAMECGVEINIKSVTPALVNDPKMTQLVYDTARGLNPKDVIDTSYRTMGSEDMAFVLNQLPGCFVFIGSANRAESLDFPHHHPHFDIDERVLPKAVALMTAASIRLMENS